MVNKINIEQLEEYLKQAGLVNGELENLLKPIKELNNQRRYGLVWEEPDNTTYGTDSAEQELLKNFPFLKEVNEHRIFNGEDHPDHLLIEGDNLHVLKTMQYTHKNKIDVIYIDPPYNTGNTDFVYNDKYVDNADSWRHSKWLSFMNKRLRLARELMTDEGVIFISIDDNEVFQLKLLCDQVFGENNFVANIIVENNPKGRKNSNHVVYTHEYMLVYSKIKDKLGKFEPVLRKKDSGKTFEDEIGVYKQGRRVLAGHDSNPKMVNPKSEKNYDVLYVKGEERIARIDRDAKGEYIGAIDVPEGSEYVIYENKNREGEANYATYTWGKLEELFEQNNLIFKERTIYEKDRNVSTKIKSVLHKESLNGVNILTETAGQKLFEIMGRDIFSFPKSVDLIKIMVKSYCNKNAIVLDFFAGSGTTAHAVMELNKEDGGNRQAIVITNNEINSSKGEDFLVDKGYVKPFTGSQKEKKKHDKWIESVNEFKETTEYKELIETDEYKDLGIARAVTEQRINKVINGYTTQKGKEVEGLTNNNFYHFEVELEPDLLDMDLNTYVLINKTKDIIKIKEDVYTDEVDISTDNTPAIKLVNDEKEVIVVQTVRVFEEDIHELVQNFNDEGKEHVIYTSYTGFEYGINNIRFEELPKELLQAIKHDENN